MRTESSSQSVPPEIAASFGNLANGEPAMSFDISFENVNVPALRAYLEGNALPETVICSIRRCLGDGQAWRQAMSDLLWKGEVSLTTFRAGVSTRMPRMSSARRPYCGDRIPAPRDTIGGRDVTLFDRHTYRRCPDTRSVRYPSPDHPLPVVSQRAKAAIERILQQASPTNGAMPIAAVIDAVRDTEEDATERSIERTAREVCGYLQRYHAVVTFAR